MKPPQQLESVYLRPEDEAEVSNKEPWLNAFHPDAGVRIIGLSWEQHRLRKLVKLLKRDASLLDDWEFLFGVWDGRS